MGEEERKEKYEPTISKLAILSFLLAVLSIPGIWAAYHNERLESPILDTLSTLFLLFAPFAVPAAVVTGFISIVRIAKSQKRLIGLGISIAGAILGTIGITLNGQLMLSRIRSKAPRMICGSNLIDLGKAMLIYANDYNDLLPTPSRWCDLLVEHTVVNKEQFRCLNVPRGPSNYAMNKNSSLSQATPDMVLLFETGPGWNQSGGSEILTTANHLWEGCNILFFDFNVRFVRAENIPKLKWKPDESQQE